MLHGANIAALWASAGPFGLPSGFASKMMVVLCAPNRSAKMWPSSCISVIAFTEALPAFQYVAAVESVLLIVSETFVITPPNNRKRL